MPLNLINLVRALEPKEIDELCQVDLHLQGISSTWILPSYVGILTAEYYLILMIEGCCLDWLELYLDADTFSPYTLCRKR